MVPQWWEGRGTKWIRITKKNQPIINWTSPPKYSIIKRHDSRQIWHSVSIVLLRRNFHHFAQNFLQALVSTCLVRTMPLCDRKFRKYTMDFVTPNNVLSGKISPRIFILLQTQFYRFFWASQGTSIFVRSISNLEITRIHNLFFETNIQVNQPANLIKNCL